MNILGIDYGQKKIGLAMADTESKFAKPLIVIKEKSQEKVFDKLGPIIKIERIEKIIIGVSEGKSAKLVKNFGKKLQDKFDLPIEYQDETLSTLDAQSLSIQAGIKRKKRKGFEDAFAAAVILHKYLEINL